MSKTRYIKDKKGKFAGSIGDGKTVTPTSAPPVPVQLSTEERQVSSEIFKMLPEVQRLMEKAAKVNGGQHNPYMPVEPSESGYVQAYRLHEKPIYKNPCPSCGVDNPALRYRSGKISYCYDCSMYKNMALRSEGKGWELNFTLEEYLDWKRGQKRACYYCGIEEKDLHKMGVKNSRANGKIPEAIGNDRWDSDKPYELSNMVLACFACNAIKSNTMSGEEFVEYFGDGVTRRSRDMVERYNTAHQYCCAA